jgi:serine protease Do
MKVGKQIASTGKVQRGWIGASIQDVTQPLAQAFGLKKPGGALISGVDKDGPAARAGLQSGDVVLKVGDAAVTRSGELPPRIADLAPGTRTTLEVWRKGEARQVAIEIGEKAARPAAQAADAPAAQGRLGLSVRPLSPDEARSMNERGGLIVEQVSGPAERAGVEPGDVVLALNGESVGTVEELRALAAKARDHAALLIRRDDARLFIPLTLG